MSVMLKYYYGNLWGHAKHAISTGWGIQSVVGVSIHLGASTDMFSSD